MFDSVGVCVVKVISTVIVRKFQIQMNLSKNVIIYHILMRKEDAILCPKVHHYYWINNGLYFNRLFLDGIVTRGCNIDIGEEQYENCRKDESCTLCQDDYCNNKVINSDANTTSSTLICIYLLLIAYFAQIFWLKLQWPFISTKLFFKKIYKKLNWVHSI